MQPASYERPFVNPSANLIASVAANDMSSSNARSRSIDGLGFGQNTAATNVVPTPFEGFALDQID